MDLSWLGTAAEQKEWALILLFVIVICIIIKCLFKFQKTLLSSVHQRDEKYGEREERLIKVMIGFSESIPNLSNAINDLRSWLNERFDDVGRDLVDIKDTQEAIENKIENHEERITVLEHPHETQVKPTAKKRRIIELKESKSS